jgi:hypothetical protein
MKKIFTFLFALAVCGSAYCADSTSKGGFIEYNKTSGVYTDMVVNGTLSSKASTEVATTNDTLTTAESGKVIVATSNAVFTLPSAANGLRYSFVDGGGVTISVDPAVADSIVYLTLDAGDKVTSPGSSADSITLVGDGTNSKWYVEAINGTWTDGGA